MIPGLCPFLFNAIGIFFRSRNSFRARLAQNLFCYSISKFLALDQASAYVFVQPVISSPWWTISRLSIATSLLSTLKLGPVHLTG